MPVVVAASEVGVDRADSDFGGSETEAGSKDLQCVGLCSGSGRESESHVLISSVEIVVNVDVGVDLVKRWGAIDCVSKVVQCLSCRA